MNTVLLKVVPEVVFLILIKLSFLLENMEQKKSMYQLIQWNCVEITRRLCEAGNSLKIQGNINHMLFK